VAGVAVAVAVVAVVVAGVAVSVVSVTAAAADVADTLVVVDLHSEEEHKVAKSSNLTIS
jgi:hypothetical protein